MKLASEFVATLWWKAVERGSGSQYTATSATTTFPSFWKNRSGLYSRPFEFCILGSTVVFHPIWRQLCEAVKQCDYAFALIASAWLDIFALLLLRWQFGIM